MKPAAILAVITILAIPVIAEVIALADTTDFPMAPTAIPGNVKIDPPQIPLPSPNLLPGTIHPLFDLGNPSPKSLAPGIYEVKPYAMMLKVPGSTADHCVIHNSSPSPMPILHPELEVIPKVARVLPAQK